MKQTSFFVALVVICFLVLLFLFGYNLYARRHVVSSCLSDILVVKPVWGLGNRLRVIRKAYALSKRLGRRLVLVESMDEFFDHPSMKELFAINKGIEFIDEQRYIRLLQGGVRTLSATRNLVARSISIKFVNSPQLISRW